MIKYKRKETEEMKTSRQRLKTRGHILQKKEEKNNHEAKCNRRQQKTEKDKMCTRTKETRDRRTKRETE